MKPPLPHSTPLQRVHVDSFDDLVEGNRALDVGVSVGMIHFQLTGGRPIMADTFRLDSDDVDALITSLRAAKELVRAITERSKSK